MYNKNIMLASFVSNFLFVIKDYREGEILKKLDFSVL